MYAQLTSLLVYQTLQNLTLVISETDFQTHFTDRETGALRGQVVQGHVPNEQQSQEGKSAVSDTRMFSHLG